MSGSSRIRRPHFGFRLPHLAASVIALSVLVSGILAPAAFAQIANWDGDVEVSSTTLTVKEGESASYQVRLTKETTDDGWWLRVFVDGSVRIDGIHTLEDENGKAIAVIRWVPSVGWEFGRDNWDQWRDITVTALQDDDDEDARVEFMHDVWDHESNCPVHERGKVRVYIVDDDGTDPPTHRPRPRPRPLLFLPLRCRP